MKTTGHAYRYALVRVDREEKITEDLHWFLDHWVIVREDGTPVLNGTPEEFEKQLRELIDARTN